MNLGLKNKVAVVLGASRGMGRACAQALALEGCATVVVARAESALVAEAREIEGLAGVPVRPMAGDVTDGAFRERCVTETVRFFKRIDILVNNCGGPRPGAFGEVFSAQDWEEAIQRSLMQVVRWTEAVLPHMHGWGRIVNIVSTTVRQPNDQLLLSNSVRPGVIGYSKTAARALAPKGITVNSVLPGLIETERARELAEIRARREDIPLERAVAERAREIPMGRLGRPEEVAAVVAFLCSEPAGYVTGEAVAVDGGFTRGV
ncbi:MAG TPA: SDR family oxidoreductase [Planctomycetota bacterium]|nr:SDR family oxidoreductase [Planctomycetota bacterium]